MKETPNGGSRLGVSVCSPQLLNGFDWEKETKESHRCELYSHHTGAWNSEQGHDTIVLVRICERR
jgi:hypothetical protein